MAKTSRYGTFSEKRQCEVLTELWNNQNRICPFCNEIIHLSVHNLHVHHVDRDQKNNDVSNLQVLHMRCHKDFHNCFKSFNKRIEFNLFFS